MLGVDKMKNMNKKGFQVGDMLPLGITIVVLGIALSLGLTVLTDFQSSQTENSSAYNGTGDAIEGLTEFTSYLPTISLEQVIGNNTVKHSSCCSYNWNCCEIPCRWNAINSHGCPSLGVGVG